MNIRFTRIPAEFLNANRVIGANRDVDATFVDLTEFSRRASRRPAVGSNDMFTRPRITRINGAIESVIAIRSNGTAARTAHPSSTTRSAGTAHSSHSRGASRAGHHASGAAHVSAARIGARTRTRYGITAGSIPAC